MNVFEMVPGKEDFTADGNGVPEGFRNVGLWSCGAWGRNPHQTPAVGDLVFIHRPNKKVVYRLTAIEFKFRGSDGNQWWTGVMQDVVWHNQLTQEIIDVLKERKLL